LTDADLRTLAGLLAKGAKAHGWHNELWTAVRVARVIEREFDLRYHPEHVREILKRRLGWTSQKPRRKARDLEPRKRLSRYQGRDTGPDR
jgi:transposase